MSKPRTIQVPVVKSELKNKVDLATSVYHTGTDILKKAREFWENNFQYSVTISEKDPFYNDILEWLTIMLPDEKHRAVAISSSRYGHDMVAPSDGRPEKVAPLSVRFNEAVTKTIRIDGHRVQISLSVPSLDDKSTKEWEYAKLVFVMNSHQAQTAVIAKLNELNQRRGGVRKPVLRMVTRWGQWTTRNDLPPRTFDSVSLPPEQKRRIAEDLRRFLEAEEKYNRLAIPYHRGYMLYGPPGTGKTSLVRALAHEFNLDLWYISLSDLKEEASLINLMSEVGPRSILLLEDIDTLKITHDRDENTPGVISMGSLLNTLDGVATPHGMIVVMTTNHFDILDEALTRPGRMDLVEELTYPTINTLKDLFKHFYGRKPVWGRLPNADVPMPHISTAQVAEIMKRHMDDPVTASSLIFTLIKER